MPSLFRRIFAKLTITGIWIAGHAIAVGYLLGNMVWDSYYPFSGVWSAIQFIGFVIAGSLLGCLFSLITTAVILAPLYQVFLHFSGGPPTSGEWVMILAGPHRGRITRVYSSAQGNSVRLELTDQERERYKDIYQPHEVQRVSEPARM